MCGSYSGILSACKNRMQKSQYQIKKGKTEAGSRWKEKCQRLLLSGFAVRIPITDNFPICFGHRYFVWISLMKRLPFSRPSLLPSALALVFGARLTFWRVTATTIPVPNLRGNECPPRTSNCREACGESPHDDRLNCWEPLKPCVPQHRDETGSNVMAAKAERNTWIAQGANLNAGKNGQSAAKPRTEGRSTTILCRSRVKRPEEVCPEISG